MKIQWLLYQDSRYILPICNERIGVLIWSLFLIKNYNISDVKENKIKRNAINKEVKFVRKSFNEIITNLTNGEKINDIKLNKFNLEDFSIINKRIIKYLLFLL
jgi:hypothetical protein